MSLTHEAIHKLEISVKKSDTQFQLTWEPEEKDMMTIWRDGLYVEPTKWFVKKDLLCFKSQIEKGSKFTVREFIVVGKRRRKKS